jgi:hypothetical protein
MHGQRTLKSLLYMRSHPRRLRYRYASRIAHNIVKLSTLKPQYEHPRVSGAENPTSNHVPNV